MPPNAVEGKRLTTIFRNASSPKVRKALDMTTKQKAIKRDKGFKDLYICCTIGFATKCLSGLFHLHGVLLSPLSRILVMLFRVCLEELSYLRYERVIWIGIRQQ